MPELESAGTGWRDTDELKRDAIEAAFHDWWARNSQYLAVGLPGDVLDLRLRLNAAAAKSYTSSFFAPRASQNA